MKMFALQKNVCANPKRFAPPRKGLHNPQKFCASQKMFALQEKCWRNLKRAAHPPWSALCAPPKKALLTVWPGKIPQ